MLAVSGTLLDIRQREFIWLCLSVRSLQLRVKSFPVFVFNFLCKELSIFFILSWFRSWVFLNRFATFRMDTFINFFNLLLYPCHLNVVPCLQFSYGLHNLVEHFVNSVKHFLLHPFHIYPCQLLINPYADIAFHHDNNLLSFFFLNLRVIKDFYPFFELFNVVLDHGNIKINRHYFFKKDTHVSFTVCFFNRLKLSF